MVHDPRYTPGLDMEDAMSLAFAATDRGAPDASCARDVTTLALSYTAALSRVTTLIAVADA